MTISSMCSFLDADLCTLIDSKFNFQITGSRFFGNANESSDWDFFTQDCEEVREFLARHAYEVVSTSYADDLNITTVYRKEMSSGSWIDIQVVDDFNKKLSVQILLKSHFQYGLPGEKRDHRQLWSMAYKLVWTESQLVAV